MKLRETCPGCGGGLCRTSFRLPRQPVVLNYRFASAAEAQQVRRRDLVLRQCVCCGLVFNAAFDPEAIPYDARYENRQCFSPAFQQHLERLANRLGARPPLRGGRILEIGCGKGDFLRLLCRRAGASGVGYDTTYEGRARTTRPSLVFHRKYATAADIRGSFDALVCRHVVEHVPDIGQFLRELHAIAVAAGDPLVIIETPSFEWIVQQVGLWDVFYEHCNYFSLPTLAHLCRRTGFRVVGHRTVFGRQYQLLELRVAGRRKPKSLGKLGSVCPHRADREFPMPKAADWGQIRPTHAQSNRLGTSPTYHQKDRQQHRHAPVAGWAPAGRGPAPGITEDIRLDRFARAARKRLGELEAAIRRTDRAGRWAIWGAGAKGVALVHRLRQVKPRFLIDSNQAKQGCFVPGSTIPIVSPDELRISELRLVLIANPNYEAEITSALRARGFAHTIRTL